MNAKSWVLSKSVLLGLIALVIGILQVTTDFLQVSDYSSVAIALFAGALLMIVSRFFKNTPGLPFDPMLFAAIADGLVGIAAIVADWLGVGDFTTAGILLLAIAVLTYLMSLISDAPLE